MGFPAREKNSLPATTAEYRAQYSPDDLASELAADGVGRALYGSP